MNLENIIEVPQELIEKHQNVELCVDIMFIQGVAFCVTISVGIKFHTVSYLKDRTAETIYCALDDVFQVYN